jgi:hypothetical protein
MNNTLYPPPIVTHNMNSDPTSGDKMTEVDPGSPRVKKTRKVKLAEPAPTIEQEIEAAADEMAFEVASEQNDADLDALIDFSSVSKDPRIAKSHKEMIRCSLGETIGNIDLLIVEERTDDEFIKQCLLPMIDKVFAKGLHNVGKKQQKSDLGGLTRRARQTAICSDVVYTGPQVAPAKLPAAPQSNYYKRSEKPDRNERNNTVGGLIVVTKRPFIVSNIEEERYEDRLADAKLTGKYTEIVLSARARARSLFFSSSSVVYSFDHSTMQQILASCYVTALNRKIPLPTNLKFQIEIAGLATPIPTPLNLAVGIKNRAEILVWLYLDLDRLMFYARSIRSEEYVTGVVYAHAVKQARLEEDKEAMESCFIDEFAEEDIGDIEEHSESARKLRSLKLKFDGRQNNNDDDSDDDIESVASSSMSINSRVSLSSSTASTSSTKSTLKKEEGFRNTPFRVLRGAEHEFSDRLRGTRRVDLEIDSCLRRDVAGTAYFSQFAASERLVARFSLALRCAWRLVDSFYKFSINIWQSMDYFYFFMLAEIQVKTQSATAVNRVVREGTAAQHVTEQTLATIDTIIERRIALLAETRESLSRLVLLAVEFSVDAASLCEPFFQPPMLLHRVIESFQMDTQLTMRQRRSRATFEECNVVNTQELSAFIDKYLLFGMRLHIEMLLARYPDRPVTHTVLRFSTKNVTPLALLSSMRCFGARDGDDCLIVWTPATMPPKSGYIFVTMTREIWRRVSCGALPRLIAETRARNNSLAREFTSPLITPSLVRALRDTDDNVVVDALCGIQAILCHSQRCQPITWGEQSPMATAHARQTAQSLRNVANALVGAVGSAANDDIAAARKANALQIALCIAVFGKAVARETVFGPLQVALNAGSSYMFMTRDRAQQYVSLNYGDSEKKPSQLAHIMREQLSLPSFQTSEDMNNYYERIAATRKQHVDGCLCGMPVTCCERLQRLRDRLFRDDVRDVEQLVMDCCRCAQVRLPKTSINDRDLTEAERDKMFFVNDDDYDPTKKVHIKRPRYKAYGGRGLCASCSDRKVVEAIRAPTNFVAIYDPFIDQSKHIFAMSAHDIIAELAANESDSYLLGLRVGSKPYTISHTVMPHRRRQYTDSDSKSIDNPRSAVTRVVEKTKELAKSRLAKIGDDTASREDNNLIALLVAIEMTLLVNSNALTEAAAANDTDKIATQLNPLSEQEMAALAIDGERLDNNGVVSGAERLFHFPLSRSALIESNGINRQTAASDRHLSTIDRSEAILFAGRTPRPLVGLPSCFMELVFTNWYDGQDETTSASSSVSATAAALTE